MYTSLHAVNMSQDFYKDAEFVKFAREMAVAHFCFQDFKFQLLELLLKANQNYSQSSILQDFLSMHKFILLYIPAVNLTISIFILLLFIHFQRH